MGKLTKAGYARAKSELGFKGKLTRKQAQRVFKRAIKKLGRTVRRVSKKGKVYYTKPKKKGKKGGKMARKKKRRGGKSITRTAFKFIRLGALVGPGFARAMGQKGDPERMVRAGLLGYAGINLDNKFDMGVLAQCWTPYLMASLVTYGIPKLTNIIRKL